MRIDNQQQQNKGVMDLMPQTGAVEEKNGIQMFADAVKTESSKKSAGTTSFQAKEVTYLNPAKEEKKTVIDEIEQSGSMDAGERKIWKRLIISVCSTVNIAWKIMKKCRRMAFRWMIPRAIRL